MLVIGCGDGPANAIAVSVGPKRISGGRIVAWAAKATRPPNAPTLAVTVGVSLAVGVGVSVMVMLGVTVSVGVSVFDAVALGVGVFDGVEVAVGGVSVP